MQLCFATNNLHKLEEAQALVGDKIKIISVEEIGCKEELPENQATFEGNAQEKALYLWEKYQINCFADDSGLEVEALNNEPGVFSARYAGSQRDNEANMQLLLQKLEKQKNRKARFITHITLILAGKIHHFEGIIQGQILHEKRGNTGFGYDPIFVPEGYNKSFAQMMMEEKNSISHRAKALQQLVTFLTQNLV